MKRGLWASVHRRNREEAELDYLLETTLQGMVNGEEPPEELWERIRAGLKGGPPACVKHRPATSRRAAICMQLGGAAAVFVATIGLLLHLNGSAIERQSVHEAFALAGMQADRPLVLTDEDNLNGKATLIAQREQVEIWRGLEPARDPLLVHRREAGRICGELARETE